MGKKRDVFTLIDNCTVNTPDADVIKRYIESLIKRIDDSKRK